DRVHLLEAGTRRIRLGSRLQCCRPGSVTARALVVRAIEVELTASGDRAGRGRAVVEVSRDLVDERRGRVFHGSLRRGREREASVGVNRIARRAPFDRAVHVTTLVAVLSDVFGPETGEGPIRPHVE